MLRITAEDALRLARAIVPTWVEHRGCVVLEEQFDAENFDSWWNTTDGHRGAIENVLNHLHLWDLLDGTGEADYPALWELADVMVVGWQASLRRAFPDREFDVTVNDDYGPTITATTAEPPGL